MAICKLGTLVVGISGTAGGLTYSRNKAGPYVKIWGMGSNPRTVRQTTTRGRLSGLGALWAGMSVGDRADWDAYGEVAPEIDYNPLGEIITLSGWQWFVRVNQRLMTLGMDTTTTVPSTDAVTPFTGVGLEVTAGEFGLAQVGWGAGECESPYSGVVFLGVHPTVGLAVKKAGLVLVGGAVHTSDAGCTFWPIFISKWGWAVVGWKCFAEVFRIRDDGVRSTVVTATYEVT